MSVFVLSYDWLILFSVADVIDQSHNITIAARAKMSLNRAQNIFMPKNINSITINITLEGIEKVKTEKDDNKTL